MQHRLAKSVIFALSLVSLGAMARLYPLFVPAAETMRDPSVGFGCLTLLTRFCTSGQILWRMHMRGNSNLILSSQAGQWRAALPHEVGLMSGSVIKSSAKRCIIARDVARTSASQSGVLPCNEGTEQARCVLGLQT